MSGFAHFICFILTCITGGFFLPLWVLFALMAGSSNRKKELRKRDQELNLLRELVKNTKGNK